MAANESIDDIERCCATAGWSLACRQLEPGDLDTIQQRMSAGAAGVLRIRSSRRLELSGRSPANGIAVLLTDSEQGMRINGSTLRNHSLLVVRPGTNVRMLVKPHTNVFLLLLPVEALAAEFSGAAVNPAAVVFGRIMLLSASARAAAALRRRLSALLDAGSPYTKVSGLEQLLVRWVRQQSRRC